MACVVGQVSSPSCTRITAPLPKVSSHPCSPLLASPYCLLCKLRRHYSAHAPHVGGLLQSGAVQGSAAAVSTRSRGSLGPARPQRDRVGAEFEEELTSWKVVGVDWSAELEEVVVWYYDVVMAED